MLVIYKLHTGNHLCVNYCFTGVFWCCNHVSVTAYGHLRCDILRFLSCFSHILHGHKWVVWLPWWHSKILQCLLRCENLSPSLFLSVIHTHTKKTIVLLDWNDFGLWLVNDSVKMHYRCECIKRCSADILEETFG